MSSISTASTYQGIDLAGHPSRRERVRQRVSEYNQQIAEVCAGYPQCRHDGGAVSGFRLEATDISSYDYFHLSARGQARLAELAWAVAGF